MLQGGSKRQEAFAEKVQASVSNPRGGAVQGFVTRPDSTGRMEVIMIGPGLDLHLRNVDALTLYRDQLSGRIVFIVNAADRDTVAQEREGQ